MGGDPDFWKKAGYSEVSWKKHKDEVAKVVKLLLENVPELKGCIKKGLGADTDEWLKFKPEDKSEADLMIHNSRYVKICNLEVSGSDVKKVNPATGSALWVLKSKYEYATSQSEPYWIWLSYPHVNQDYLLTLEIIRAYEKNVITVYIKLNPQTGQRIPEQYIEIPPQAALPKEAFFTWLKERLSQT